MTMNALRIADPVVNAYVLLLSTSDIVARYAERRLCLCPAPYPNAVEPVAIPH